VAYYIRVLSPSDSIVPVATIHGALDTPEFDAAISVAGPPECWEKLLISRRSGAEIALIDRSPFEDGSIGSEEISEFLDEIKECKPQSAAVWLAEYLPKVRTIYAIQILAGTYEHDGWEVVGAVKEALLGHAGGIIQADGEGFSNEDGYHILWQFSETVSGAWYMAVRRGDEWVQFEMDLGNPDHRASFIRGEIPSGVKFSE
jgi:hypothetical protein